jgi:quercetin dioxygenase-like cupin family protein
MAVQLDVRHPYALAPGAGETITERPEREVRILVGLDGIAITESRYGPGERGPEAHVHRHHADAFLVLDGELTLTLTDGERRAPAGTWLLVPPHVVHSFRNDGSSDARFLNLHSPGMGFDRYLRGELPDFDQHEAPADGGAAPTSVVVCTSDTAEAVSIGENRVAFLAGVEETLGGAGIVEYTATPSFGGPPRHVHRHTFDMYYVLEGALRVFLGDALDVLHPGSYGLVPPGIVHTFENPSADEPVRFLNIHSPGGFEQYFREAAAARGAWADPAVRAEIASRYDFEPA